MKKNSKKRVLLSSVAMLMVGAVSLGTATFAWFTQNTEAKADSIYAKAVKTSSLEVSKMDQVWAPAVSYDLCEKDAEGKPKKDDKGNIIPKTFYPASSANGGTWFYARAAASNASAFADKSIAQLNTSESVFGRYVYTEMLNVKNAGTEGNIDNIKISINFGTEDVEYARVALVPCAKPEAVNKQGAEYGSAPSDFTDQVVGFASNVFDTDGEAYAGLTNVSGAATSITAKNAHADGSTPGATVNVGTLEPSQERYYNLYVWFEGQDAQCYDAKVDQTIKNLTFTISGDMATIQ